MTYIQCDSCKKVIPGARRDVNYIVHLDKEICIPCEEKLLEKTRVQTAYVRPYNFRDYQTAFVANLHGMCKARG